MPGSGSRHARVAARSLSLALLALATWHAPLACFAGESFLIDNAKAPGAVPYGRTIDEIAHPAHGGGPGRFADGVTAALEWSGM